MICKKSNDNMCIDVLDVILSSGVNKIFVRTEIVFYYENFFCKLYCMI
jgi:hypothetical protein